MRVPTSKIKEIINRLLEKRQPRERIGIDLGTSSVKFVHLEQRNSDFILKNYAVKELGVSNSEQEIASLIKGVLESFKSTGAKINLGIGGPSVVIRYVSLPQMAEADFKKSLQFEASHYIPFSIDSVNVDGCILKKLSDNKMLVLIAAAKKDLILQRINLLQQAGFRVSVVDIDSLALINSFLRYARQESDISKGSVALLNIGASISSINILEEGVPFLSRDIHIAGNNLTHKVADSLSVDLKEAQKIKVAPPEDKKEKIRRAIEPVITHLVAEVRSSLDYYESQRVMSVSRIFLSGGGCLCFGAEEFLASSLGLPVVNWSALETFQIAPDIEPAEIEKNICRLGVAVGLALR
jgi:type IV pilus assembly protein PilM